MSRAREIGRSVKGTAVQAIGGVGSYYAHKLASENIAFVRDNFWMGPAVLGIVGHFLKRRMGGLGASMIGAGGYALAMGFALDQAKSSQEAKGLIDVGAWSPSSLPDNMATASYPELAEAYPTGGEVEVSPTAYSIGR